MAFRVRRADPAYDDPDIDGITGELLAGERAGPPLPRTGATIIRRGAALLMLAGCGWIALAQDAAPIRTLLGETATTLAASLQAVAPERGPQPPSPGMATTNAATALPPIEERPAPMASAPPPADPAPAAPVESASTAVLPPPAAKPEAYAAPPAEPIDPLQARAEAAGLHPGISRAVLERLTDADYRNAATAIKTATTETADDAVLVWPRQRKPELALFQVKFVTGAAPGCRRYVVTITKDRWSTTALPMERCGAELARARQK